MERRRLLVTGSRGWKDAATIWRILHVAWTFDPGMLLVSGACPRGADLLCETYWDEYLGGGVERHPADWRTGLDAGFRRSEHMVHLGAWGCTAFIMPCEKTGCAGRPPDRGLDYHGTHGGVHCANYAEDHGIPVRRFAPIAVA